MARTRRCRWLFAGLALVAVTPRAPAADPAADPPGLAELFRDRHPWTGVARDMAARTPPGYGDVGQWSYLMHAATADPRYARAAAARGLTNLRAVGDAVKSRNATREDTILMARLYAGLRPALTPDEDRAWRAELTRWAELIVGRGPIPWGTRTDDSDETTGHYFGLALIDRALGTDYLGGTWKDGNTGAPVPVARMREAVRRYCRLAAGGEWVESGWEYNGGTLQLLFCGALWAGAADYPEVTALAPQAADWLTWAVAPDLRSQAGWGDCEPAARRQLIRHQWVSLLGVLAGGYADHLGPGRTATARRLIRELTRGNAPTAYPDGYWFTLYRPLLCGFDPRATDREPYAAPAGLRATAAGSAVHRGPDFLLHVFSQPPVGIDHETASVGEVRLRVGGADVVDSLLGYGPDAVDGGAKNAPLAYGLAALADRRMESAEPTPDGGSRVVCRAAGRPAGGTYLPPAPIGWVERVVAGSADGRRVGVTDTFDLSPPLRPGRGPGEAIYTGRSGADARAVAQALDDPAGVRACQVLWWVRGPYTLRTADGVSTLSYAAGGRPVTVTVRGHARTAEDRADDLYPKSWQFVAEELKDATRVRFVTADRRATIRSEVVVGAGPGR